MTLGELWGRGGSQQVTLCLLLGFAVPSLLSLWASLPTWIQSFLCVFPVLDGIKIKRSEPLDRQRQVSGTGHPTSVGKLEGWTPTWRKCGVVPGLDQTQHQGLGNQQVGINLGDSKNLFLSQLQARNKGRLKCKLFKCQSRQLGSNRIPGGQQRRSHASHCECQRPGPQHSLRSWIEPGRPKMAGAMTGNPQPNKEEKARKPASSPAPNNEYSTLLLTTVDKNRNLNPQAQSPAPLFPTHISRVYFHFNKLSCQCPSAHLLCLILEFFLMTNLWDRMGQGLRVWDLPSLPSNTTKKLI